jgi:hypothetical protein
MQVGFSFSFLYVPKRTGNGRQLGDDAEHDHARQRDVVEHAHDGATDKPKDTICGGEQAESRGTPAGGTMVATAAGMIDRERLFRDPTDRRLLSATQKPPRNTRGANTSDKSVSGIKMEIPNRSKRRRKSKDPVPLTAIATE